MTIKPFLQPLGALLVLTIATMASAQERPRWSIAEGLGFTRSELTSAIEARTQGPAETLPCSPLEVRFEGEHRVLAICGEKAQVIDLGERTGPDAARVIALVLLDLAQSALSLPMEVPPPAAHVPRSAQALEIQVKPLTSLDAPVPVKDPMQWTRTRSTGDTHLWGAAPVGLARGLGANDATMSWVAASVQLRRSKYVLEVGYSQQASHAENDLDVALRLRSVHAGFGIDLGAVRGLLEAGATSIKSLTLSSYLEYTAFSGVRLERPYEVLPGLELSGWASSRLFQGRADFRVASQTIRTTPRVQFGVGLAVAGRFGGR